VRTGGRHALREAEACTNIHTSNGMTQSAFSHVTCTDAFYMHVDLHAAFARVFRFRHGVSDLSVSFILSTPDPVRYVQAIFPMLTPNDA
jgi:hypothetical protein